MGFVNNKIGALPGNCTGFENLSVTNVAGGVSMTIPTTSQGCLIIARSGGTRGDMDILRYLEVSPTVLTVTSAVGMLVDDGNVFEIKGYANMNNFRAISTSATAHTLLIQYYK